MEPGTKSVAIIGGGPAGLMAAEVLSGAGQAVTVYDRMPSVGRKFLMAGRGGLNLTHSEPPEHFLPRYRAAEARLRPAIEAFPPRALRAWAEALGQKTFVGSSGRIFPEELKASPLLRAWLGRLAAQGVRLAPRRNFLGWDETGRLRIGGPDGVLEHVAPDATILAMGGASWPKLGSDGGWADMLAARGVAVTPLRPANCGFVIKWTEPFRTRFAGAPLKNIAISFGGETVRGEAVVTGYGIEGGAIYALSAPLRDATARGPATLRVDLRPDSPAEMLARRLSTPRPGQSLSNVLRKAVGLSPVEINLLREATGLAVPREPEWLAALVKAVPLELAGPQSLERAISTAGGIAFTEVDASFMLHRMPGVFVAGEMLDWEAPTGGYLLQACFATGAAAGRGALAWLGRTQSVRGAA